MDIMISGIAGLLALKNSDKLIDTIQMGAGWVLKPLQQKRMAKATHNALELLKNDLLEYNAELKIEDGKISFIAKAEATELEVYQLAVIEKEVRRQINAANIIEKTAKILEDKEEISETPVDVDWTARYFEIVQNISNEDVQFIWSKILADEIAKPNSYSLRTLELLKNINSKEAKIFSKIYDFVFQCSGEFLISNDEDILQKNGLKKEEQWLLEELNLVKRNMTITLTKDKETFFVIKNKLVKVISNNNSQISVMILTNVGKELYNLLVDCQNTNIEPYLFDVFNENHQVYVSKIIKKYPTQVEHDDFIKLR